jgi:hypothetical protein
LSVGRGSGGGGVMSGVIIGLGGLRRDDAADAEDANEGCRQEDALHLSSPVRD